MPKGSALSQGSSGESVSHFTAIRMRVNGTGNLQLKVYSLDDVRFDTLLAVPMAEPTNIIPTRLCNFIEFRASFEGKTTEIDEFFRFSRIVIFSKELWTSIPG